MEMANALSQGQNKKKFLEKPLRKETNFYGKEAYVNLMYEIYPKYKGVFGIFSGVGVAK